MADVQQITREQVEAVLQQLECEKHDPDKMKAYILLSVLTTPRAHLHQALRRVGNQMVSTLRMPPCDMPERLKSIIPDGAVLFSKRDGNPYTSINSVTGMAGRLLTTMFSTPVTHKDIQLLFVETEEDVEKSEDRPPPPYMVLADDMVEVEPRVDADIAQVLQHYKVYTTHYGYHFILLELPSGMLVRYDVSRVVAGLPYYNHLSGTLRLPTVDHISRDRSNNSMQNLRYCTIAQNAYNKCWGSNAKVETMYHNVSDLNGGVIFNTNNPVYISVLMVALTWFALLASQWESFAVNKLRTLLPVVTEAESVFDRSSCRSRHLGEIGPHIPLMEAFLGELLEVLVEVCESGSGGYDVAPRTRLLQLQAIPQCHYESRMIMSSLVYGHDTPFIKVSRVLRPSFLGALAIDAVKVVIHKSFAHTNFMRVPAARPTVAEFRKQEPVVASQDMPVEVMAKFEELCVDDMDRFADEYGQAEYVVRDDVGRWHRQYRYNSELQRIKVSFAAGPPKPGGIAPNTVSSTTRELIWNPYTIVKHNEVEAT